MLHCASCHPELAASVTFFETEAHTNQDKNLLLLDDPGRVRSQIASIVRQIQRFDFDRNLVVTRKIII
jgi:hypothetical protein